MSIPLILNVHTPIMSDLSYLASRGVKINHPGNLAIAASIQAIYDTLEALAQGALPGDVKRLASDDLMKAVLRQGDYTKWTDQYL